MKFSVSFFSCYHYIGNSYHNMPWHAQYSIFYKENIAAACMFQFLLSYLGQPQFNMHNLNLCEDTLHSHLISSGTKIPQQWLAHCQKSIKFKIILLLVHAESNAQNKTSIKSMPAQTSIGSDRCSTSTETSAVVIAILVSLNHLHHAVTLQYQQVYIARKLLPIIDIPFNYL